jgi:UDP-3-O-[3-hydroxymyristoyl] glucosamine N-acyltransferase
MGSSQFYARSGPFSVGVVATAAGTPLPRRDLTITGVAPLQNACATNVSFLDNRRYASALETTLAGAVIVHPDMEHRVPSSAVPLVTKTPYEGWARVAQLFHPVPPLTPGIHPTAYVDPDAVVDATAEIGPFAFVGARAQIGARCILGPHATISSGVVIGKDSRIGSHVSVSHALVGARVVLHPGARIGQEGFSFAHTRSGFLTIPQLGRVIVEDDVEIGANSTVDRGSTQDTVLGAGSRLDNLVQIGHNVRLGRCCVIVAQVGISGSTVLGDFVQVGGQAAMAGHLRIGDRARIGAQAGVISHVPDDAILLGSPAQSRQQFFRQVSILRRIASRRPNEQGDESLSPGAV